MITNKRPVKEKIEIDLQGPEGNAIVLLSIAKDLSYKLGKNWDEVHDNMTSRDYEWLIQVMDHYFGDFIVMYR
jgi:hypothetical protein